MEGMKLFKNKFTKGKIYASLSLSLLLTLSFPGVIRAGAAEAASPEKSIFYVKLINYALPLVKSVAASEDDLAEYDYSVGNRLLELLGIDVSDPLSVVGREVGLFTPTEMHASNNDGKITFSINPFKLGESSINKNQEQNNPPGNNAAAPAVNIAKVYDATLKKTLNPSKPEVLIYHTHTTESYRPAENAEDGSYPINVTDETKNIVAVGDAIANDLEKNYGISVIHDKTVHSMMFTQAYARSGKTVDTYLDKYKDFKLIIDLHRDSIEDKAAMTVSMNDNKLAKFLFVIGPGNPNKEKNITVSKKLVGITQGLFPGLIRSGTGEDFGLFYHKKGNKFNQQKSGNLVLVEVGSITNTLDEAKTTGLYLSRVIAEYINRK
jgi:stage II sporulation protein P